MVVIDACRRLSCTVVSVAPLVSAWVAWVCRIQCGVARRSFWTSIGSSASITSAAVRKNRRSISLRRGVVMLPFMLR